MDPVICSNCRLPVRLASGRCPQCNAAEPTPEALRALPVAAALAALATWTLVLRRKVA